MTDEGKCRVKRNGLQSAGTHKKAGGMVNVWT